ncbi:MAG: glycosyltransferase [Thermoanaerobaculaceae bacterium]|nr:glycosyltransferase [Thermoanaerobaculaceae bacterium]MDI9621495.1 glycosyltransferase [Acidobacteriota bacterium]
MEGSSVGSGDACSEAAGRSDLVPELSVVVPVVNGAGFISESLTELGEFLSSRHLDAEIVVVDDGSDDGTASEIDRAASRCPVPVVVRRHDRNLGKGAAVRTGMQAAHGRYRVFLDADLAYPAAEIGVVLERLRAGAQVVVASRVHPESRYVIRPSFFRYLYTRHISGRFFNWLVRVLLLPGVSDTQAGLKGFSAEAAGVLFGGWLPDGFGFDLAVLARARRAGMELAEVPVTFRYDREPSTMRFVADTVDMLRDLVAVRVRVGHGGAVLPPLGERERATLTGAAWTPPWRLLAVLALLLGGVEVARALAAPLLVPLGLWLGALGLWLGHGFTGDRARGIGPTRWFEDRVELAVVVGIVLLAAFFRLAALGEVPALIHHDTASCALVGKAMLTGGSRDPFALEQTWYHFPRLGLLPYAVSLKLLGTSVVSLRLVSALPGILLVPALYFLVRGWFGRAAATIAGLYLASNHVAVHFSRDGIWNIHSLTLGVIGFGALFGGWRRRSGFWLGVAGTALGLCLYTYTAGRLFFGLGVLAAGAMIWRQRPRVSREAAHLIVALGVTVAPLMASYVRVPVALKVDQSANLNPFSEARHEHVMGQVGSAKPLAILAYQARHTLAGFVSEGDSSSHYMVRRPLIGPVTLALAILGVVFGVARLPDPRFAFLFAWLGAGLVFGSILTINPPSFPRLLAVLPVPMILASAVAGLLWEKLSRVGNVVRACVALGLSAVVAVTLVRNVRIYLAFSRGMETTVNEWVVIRELREMDQARTVYFFTGPYMLADSPAFELFREGRRHVYGLTEADLPQRIAEPTAFILAPTYRWVGRPLTERFPELERELVERRGVRLLTIYRSWGQGTNERSAR